MTILVCSILSLSLSSSNNNNSNFLDILLPPAALAQEGEQQRGSGDDSFSNNNGDGTSSGSDDINYITYWEPNGYFSLEVPDSWTTRQAEANHDVETATAVLLCPPAGCAEANVQLFAYLSTSGSFFPSGNTDPEEVFKGLVKYNEAQGFNYESSKISETKDHSAPLYTTEFDYVDDSGQNMHGNGVYVLSKLGILWEAAFIAKQDNWDPYKPIFQHMISTISPLYPSIAYCHENRTQFFRMEMKRTCMFFLQY